MPASEILNKPRMIISAPAVPARLGSGLNLRDLVEGARAAVELELFALAPYSGIPTHRVPPSRLARTPLGWLPDWHVMVVHRAFDRYVAARLPRAEIVQALGHGCALRTLRTARAAGARCVLDCVTTHIDDYADNLRRATAEFGLRPMLHPRLHRTALAEYAEADVIRVMSHHARATFLERGHSAERLVMVPPVVEVDEFPLARFDEDRFRIIYVGRLDPGKGVHYLVEAYERLALAGAELELWGGPGSRAIARWLAARQRRIPSLHVRAQEVQVVGYAEAYGRANVLVHPSLTDGYAYVVAEAMACGLPVIVTDQTGAAELVEEGVNGYVVPARDPNAIAERLAHLHAHPEVLPTMGAAARRAAASLSREAFRARYLAGALGLRSEAAAGGPSGVPARGSPARP